MQLGKAAELPDVRVSASPANSPAAIFFAAVLSSVILFPTVMPANLSPFSVGMLLHAAALSALWCVAVVRWWRVYWLLVAWCWSHGWYVGGVIFVGRYLLLCWTSQSNLQTPHTVIAILDCIHPFSILQTDIQKDRQTLVRPSIHQVVWFQVQFCWWWTTA